MRRYFCLVDESKIDGGMKHPPVGEKDGREAAVVDNIEEFLEDLFSSREEAWRGALERPELEGKVLDERLFEQLLQRLEGLGAHQARFLEDSAWIARLLNHLSGDQTVRFTQKTGLSDIMRGQLAGSLAALDPAAVGEQSLAAGLDALARYAAVPWPETLRRQLQPDEQLVTGGLLALFNREGLELKQRAEAGDILGQLGAPRPGVGLGDGKLPDIDWVEIPAGPVTLGSAGDDPEAWDGEKDAHSLALPAFRIARYPITNAQYRPFVAVGGYENRRYWSEAGWGWRQGADYDLNAIEDEEFRKLYRDWLAKRPRDRRDRPYWWDESLWNSPSRPVVGVSWYEAGAYCRWLDEELRRAAGEARPLGKGRIILASEAQWEKAARGGEGRRWPWGDGWLEGRANTEEAGLRGTSPVGLFPDGASPYGVQEMAGNVWEWTHSRWGVDPATPEFQYPYAGGDGREDPDAGDLRGGSWLVGRRNARCACRYWAIPVNYLNSLGFRVVFSLVDTGS